MQNEVAQVLLLDDDRIVLEMTSGTVFVYSCKQILGLEPVTRLTQADEESEA